VDLRFFCVRDEVAMRYGFHHHQLGSGYGGEWFQKK
jgi:hypothetical protein